MHVAVLIADGDPVRGDQARAVARLEFCVRVYRSSTAICSNFRSFASIRSAVFSAKISCGVFPIISPRDKPHNFSAALLTSTYCKTARVLDEYGHRDILDDAIEEFAVAVALLLRAHALGDVDNHDQTRRPALVLQPARVNLGDKGRSVRLLLAPFPTRLVLVHDFQFIDKVRPTFGRAQIERSQRQKLFAPVAVMRQRRVVHREKAQAFDVEDEHRQSIVVKQQTKRFFLLLLLGDVLKSRDPSAVGHRPIDHAQDPAVETMNDFR